MKLEFLNLKDKGPIVQAPVLKGWAQKVSVEVQSWRTVVSATHWAIEDSTRVDGTDFYVGEKELGHIHLNGEIHLGLNKNLVGLLIQAKLAEPFPWGDNWVQFPICDTESARHGLWLFRLGYDRLNGTSITELKIRINAASKLLTKGALNNE